MDAAGCGLRESIKAEVPSNSPFRLASATRFRLSFVSLARNPLLIGSAGEKARPMDAAFFTSSGVAN